MRPEQMKAAILARHDQDEAACADWWNALSVGEKVRLWFYINHRFSNPFAEAMSRLAILKFEDLYLSGKAGKERAE